MLNRPWALVTLALLAAVPPSMSDAEGSIEPARASSIIDRLLAIPSGYLVAVAGYSGLAALLPSVGSVDSGTPSGDWQVVILRVLVVFVSAALAGAVAAGLWPSEGRQLAASALGVLLVLLMLRVEMGSASAEPALLRLVLLGSTTLLASACGGVIVRRIVRSRTH